MNPIDGECSPFTHFSLLRSSVKFLCEIVIYIGVCHTNTQLLFLTHRESRGRNWGTANGGFEVAAR